MMRLFEVLEILLSYAPPGEDTPVWAGCDEIKLWGPPPSEMSSAHVGRLEGLRARRLPEEACWSLFL